MSIGSTSNADAHTCFNDASIGSTYDVFSVHMDVQVYPKDASIGYTHVEGKPFRMEMKSIEVLQIMDIDT